MSKTEMSSEQGHNSNNKALVWFRNDLRLDDNPALCAALQHSAVAALCFISEPQWRRFHMAEIKIDFIKRHIELLKQQLANLNIQLQVVEVDDFAAQIDYLTEYCNEQNIQTVYANSELELDEWQRDKTLVEFGVPLTLFEADTIVAKGSVKNQQGQMYRVFSAFRRAWLQQIQQFGFNVLDNPQAIEQALSATKNTKNTDNIKQRASSAWPLADRVLSEVLPRFLAEKVDDYHQHRDIPGIKGTSGLSPYLAIGAVSSRRLLQQLLQAQPKVFNDTDTGAFSWLNELIWRDFYRHLLFHYPNLVKGESFNPKYQNLTWPDHQALFELWQAGKTGFPIIDAAIRQLKKTGWMHNRLRMIVASFLTKNLLVDWRLGERFFMSHLIDGDFAANNGGWQWSAGTGCDAQPYFRVFNPVTQSKKFDPQGDFIRNYLPELNHVPDQYIHAPYQYLTDIGEQGCYWPEIVDLKQTRLAAIDFYRTDG